MYHGDHRVYKQREPYGFLRVGLIVIVDYLRVMPKATIGAAASIAVETDTIKIRPGLYIEDNPIGLRTDVSVTGEDLRLVTVQSKNKSKDVFHVRRGCLIENLNFGGSNVGVSHQEQHVLHSQLLLVLIVQSQDIQNLDLQLRVQVVDGDHHM